MSLENRIKKLEEKAGIGPVDRHEAIRMAMDALRGWSEQDLRFMATTNVGDIRQQITEEGRSPTQEELRVLERHEV